ncbi:glycerophosphodiester phosphodiesterase family protein [Ectobacillus ponti]|uniref:Glycerophosphodiester phosphodiesterase n=1 Tax=Ectobacillus ponti TaxID=2961894 RepID=A0AA41X757_9BACI|nr:glycerophosphodiester phosphodiesterase family protein [Ectobacillus ponti]MCP8970067.1 glycerophosphodiester phosphodiesterase [Ectobacillus ponti]
MAFPRTICTALLFLYFGSSPLQASILNIAHGGASGYMPGNTLAAFKLARQLHGDYIEMDVHMTKDGQLVAIHDATLDRTTNGTGLIKEHTLAEIQRLRMDMVCENCAVPSLASILERFGTGARYYIELKSPWRYPGMERKLLEVLWTHGLTGPQAQPGGVILESFDARSLQTIHRLEPDIPLIQLVGSTPATERQLAAYQTYCAGLGIPYQSLSQAYVQQVRKHGLQLHAFTVNEKADMRRLVEWGVTGIFTDFPDRLYEVLQEI